MMDSNENLNNQTECKYANKCKFFHRCEQLVYSFRCTGMCAVKFPSVLYSWILFFETSISHEAVWLLNNGVLHKTPNAVSIYFLLSVWCSASGTSGMNLHSLWMFGKASKKDREKEGEEEKQVQIPTRIHICGDYNLACSTHKFYR